MAPRAPLAPTMISARLQSSVAREGAAAGDSGKIEVGIKLQISLKDRDAEEGTMPCSSVVVLMGACGLRRWKTR